MTVRGAEGSDAERRATTGKRVHFETLVAVGDPTGRGGFEAESMDISAEGMRLRTAYLPDVGERLVCRFDGGGQEIVVEGEVLWRIEQPRGGEFAVRFAKVEEPAASALKSMCAAMAPTIPGDAPSAAEPTTRGTRVRLHIEGLGSPMKARVTGADSGEVRVGSNLDFLRVGRSLELEDVDHGMKRDAFIDTVRVEMNPASSVPQLVVGLRYGQAPAKRQSPPGHISTLPYGVRAAKPAAGDAPITTREPDPGSDGSEQELDRDLAAVEAAEEPDLVDPPAADEARAEDEAAEGGDEQGFRGAGAKAAKAGLAMANKLGPALAGVGARAKGAVQGLAAAIQKKRVERAEAKKAAAPRRMTAPPPAGALKSEGRRLVREDDSDDDEAPPPPRSRINKKAIALGSVTGVVVVVGAFAIARGMGGSGGRTPTVDASADARHAAVTATAAPGLPPPPVVGGALSTNVPLFGATPLSTTETVPVTPPGDPSAVAAVPGAPGADAADKDGDEEPGLEEGAASGDKKQFGSGSVKHPIVLKLKMDGPIEGINGAAGAMGFTISLPNRRSLSSASELARKDKRIASLNVVNNAHGAEVTVQFKDGVPPYVAKAKGDRLEIALGSEKDHHKVASKGKKKSDAEGKSGGKSKTKKKSSKKD